MTWAFSATKHPLLTGCLLPTSLRVRRFKKCCVVGINILLQSNEWKIMSKGKDEAALLSLHSE